MPFKTDYRKKRQQRIDPIGRFIMFSNEYRIYARGDDIIPADGIHVESFFRRSSIKKEREREREKEREGRPFVAYRRAGGGIEKPAPGIMTEDSNQSSRLRSIAVR